MPAIRWRMTDHSTKLRPSLLEDQDKVPVQCLWHAPEPHLAARLGTSTPAALRSMRCTSSNRARSDAVDMRPVSSLCCRAAITAPCDPCTAWAHSLGLWGSSTGSQVAPPSLQVLMLTSMASHAVTAAL